MTILGKHTIAETRDLIAATDYRVMQMDRTIEAVRTKRPVGPYTAEETSLENDYGAFKERWAKCKGDALFDLRMLSISNPLAPEDMQSAEAIYKRVDDCVRVTNPRLVTIQQRIDSLAVARGVTPIDLSKMGSFFQSGDVDFDGLKKIDAGIKAGEDAASKTVKSNTALYVAGGAIGALVLIGAVKVYL